MNLGDNKMPLGTEKTCMISVTVFNVLPVKNRENTGFFVVLVHKFIKNLSYRNVKCNA